MASAELSRRVEKVVGYPPLSELDDLQRREFHEALLEAATFEDLPGKWQAAILAAEQNRPKLRVVIRHVRHIRCHIACHIAPEPPKVGRDCASTRARPGSQGGSAVTRPWTSSPFNAWPALPPRSWRGYAVIAVKSIRTLKPIAGASSWKLASLVTMISSRLQSRAIARSPVRRYVFLPVLRRGSAAI
jgi:hypothetical protein